MTFQCWTLTLKIALNAEEKEARGYNVIMLEHTLCKMKCLTTHKISIEDILSEI